MIPLFFLAMGESEAAEETLSGGQEEGRYSPESDEALVSSSPQSCVCHPAGRLQIPSSEAPAEGSTGHYQSSGTTVSHMNSKTDFVCNLNLSFMRGLDIVTILILFLSKA